MKSYIAKWLTVPGFREVRDWFQIRTHGIPGKIPPSWTKPKQVADDNLSKMLPVIEESDIGKVKLFLCSRDIKVGDKNVYSDICGAFEEDNGGPEIIAEIKTDFQLGVIKAEAEAGQVIPFKIVGPISVRVKWITEDLELDEGDFREAGEWIWNHYRDEDVYHKLGFYEIKCSCCGSFV